MPFSKENLSQIITELDFNKLIGEVENEWFDCKSQPYNLDTEKQKMELSKDVTSFANYQGGYIFLGIKTEKRPDKYGDVIKEINEKNMSERFDVIEGLLKNPYDNKFKGKMIFEEKSLNEETLKSRIDDSIKAIDAENKRLMILSAHPHPLTELGSIFSNNPDSIRRKLENPPYLRYSGWNINTLDQSRIVKGKSIRVKNGDRKVIDLYRDGGMIFVCLADEKFLAWSGTETNQFIYSLSLIEVVYEFVRFYKLVTEDMKTAPAKVTLKARFKNMYLNNVITRISPYKLNSSQVPLPVDAPEDDFEVVVDCDFADFNVGKMAYRLVEEIYLRFGIETNIIPYTKDVGGVKEIDPEQILAV